MNPVRVGVMGLGDFGLAHIEAYRSLPGVEVAAVASRSAERAAEVARRYDIAHAFASYEALAKSELDAVSVVTAEDQHLSPVLCSLSAGKHVLVEKPIATAAADARRMIDAARWATGRVGRRNRWRLNRAQGNARMRMTHLGAPDVQPPPFQLRPWSRS